MSDSDTLRQSIVESCPVHDNHLYAYEFDSRTSTLILRTAYPHSDPPEFTDVWFLDVWCHHVECILGGDIIFDIDDSDLVTERTHFESLFDRLKNQGWPPIEKIGESFDAVILRHSLRVWHISSSYGIDGFVIARERRTVQNQSEAPQKLLPPATA